MSKKQTGDSSQTIIIDLKDRKLSLTWYDFTDYSVDMEQVLQVDLNNIILDLVTFSALFNRVGNYKAEIDSMLREKQLDCSIMEAELYSKHKKAKLAIGEKATEGSIETAIKLDPAYRVKKIEVINLQREADLIDSLYWAAKDKSKKLESMSAKLQPEEFSKEIIEGKYNDVQIRIHKNYNPYTR